MATYIKRIQERASAGDGARVLVDRVWPRGVRKADARVDRWAREVAPSSDLRKWFNHDPDRFAAFAEAYRAELEARPDAVGALVDLARQGDLTLLYAARDTRHNHARVLADYLDERLAARR